MTEPLNYKELILELEEFMRVGHAWSAEKRLATLTWQKIPEKYKLSFANIFRRIGKPEQGIRLLAEEIRRTDSGTPPNEPTVIEYSLCLNDIGASNEALHWLNRICGKEYPQALVFKVHFYFLRWQYQEGIKTLQEHLACEKIDPYQRNVSLINLAAAYALTDQPDRCIELTKKIFEASMKNKWTRLMINSLEIRSQALLALGRLPEAQKTIKMALDQAISSSLIDRFYVEKWHAIIEARINNDTSSLLKLRKVAIERKYWESVRDLDYHCFLIHQDKALLNKIFFGTPYDSFRQRLMPFMEQIGDKYYYPKKTSRVLDLESGRIDGKEVIPPGKKIHQLIELLVRDFYQPVSLGVIFNNLFPNENFDALNSPDRVHQLLHRSRTWFSKKNLDLEIDCTEGVYSLVPGKDLCLKKSKVIYNHSPHAAKIQLLKTHYGDSPFSSLEAGIYLSASNSNINRILKSAVDDGRLSKIGKGKNTRYQF